jgi:hypothetical protein
VLILGMDMRPFRPAIRAGWPISTRTGHYAVTAIVEPGAFLGVCIL